MSHLGASAKLRHNLPQIPTRGAGTRTAISKASAKDAGEVNVEKINFVPIEEIENSAISAKTDEKSGNMFPTPPSSDTSPKANQPSPGTGQSIMNNASPPVKLKIKKNLKTGKNKAMIKVEEATAEFTCTASMSKNPVTKSSPKPSKSSPNTKLKSPKNAKSISPKRATAPKQASEEIKSVSTETFLEATTIAADGVDSADEFLDLSPASATRKRCSKPRTPKRQAPKSKTEAATFDGAVEERSIAEASDTSFQSPPAISNSPAGHKSQTPKSRDRKRNQKRNSRDTSNIILDTNITQDFSVPSDALVTTETVFTSEIEKTPKSPSPSKKAGKKPPTPKAQGRKRGRKSKAELAALAGESAAVDEPNPDSSAGLQSSVTTETLFTSKDVEPHESSVTSETLVTSETEEFTTEKLVTSVTEQFTVEKIQGQGGGSSIEIPIANKPLDLEPRDDDGFPILYKLGDLLWAKVSGHPWWPCMAARDPFTGIFTQIMQRRSYVRSYHVHFFGEEGERGWILGTNILVYQGEKALHDHCHEMKLKMKKNKSKALLDKYNSIVRPTRKRAWDIACVEIYNAIKLSVPERIEKFNPLFDEIPVATPLDTSGSVPNGTANPPSKGTKKRKRKPSLSDEHAKSPPKKRAKRVSSVQSSQSPSSDSEDSIVSPSHIRVNKKMGNQVVVRFLVFCQKRRDMVRREHPGYTAKRIEQCLQQQWDAFDPEEQSKFIPMGSDVKNMVQIMADADAAASAGKRGVRAIKPTKKKQEADQDNEVVLKNWRKSGGGAGRSPQSRSFMSPRLVPDPIVDAIIDSVAAGAGQILAPERCDPLPEEFVDLGDESVVRSLEDSLTAADGRLHDEASSQSSSKEDGEESNGNRGSRGGRPPHAVIPGDEDYVMEIFKLSSTWPRGKDNVCAICEESGELIDCEGPCLASYHLSCLGLIVPPSGSFRCDECGSGKHTCFVCKQSSAATKRCATHGCGRFYHKECIKELPLSRQDTSGKQWHCPLHTCVTCHSAESKSTKAHKGRMFRCVRCPTAFHAGDLCVAAGSYYLGGYAILCSSHFQAIKAHAHHQHININWCFLCSKGGTLLCCESCPAAFHTECLKIEAPTETWFCSDCASGRKPLYGNIVWVKLGSYRWWPGEICHPRNVPLNIQDKPHQVGEFPIRFFGSHDYYWMHKARIFLFQDGDKGSKDTTSTKHLAKIFRRAVFEASAAYKIWVQTMNLKELQDRKTSDKKPPSFKQIKINLPIGNVHIFKPDPSTLSRCECKPDQEAPCGPHSDCLNRNLLFECHPAICPAGEKCQNQQFVKRQYPETVPFKTTERGWGLKSVVEIKKGDFVYEYVGDLIDEAECRRRMEEAHENDISNFYMLTLDKNRIIDAGPRANLSRFMNHSCEANCEAQKWTVNGDLRVGLFAVKDIPPDAEVTFNYNLDSLGNEKCVCHCGAAGCSGFIGLRPKTVLDGNKDGQKDKKKKKKKKISNLLKVSHEDVCYRCGEGGQLILCDRLRCPKVYDLKCLNLDKSPHGKWICPWHHCDCCGKLAVKLCSECPNSYCQAHLQGNIFLIPDDKLICLDHEDLLSVVEASRLEALENDPNAVPPCMSSSEGTPSVGSSGSSPNPTDSDSGSDSAGTEPPVVPEVDRLALLTEKVGDAKGEAPTHRIRKRKNNATLPDEVPLGDSDSSEGRLVIAEEANHSPSAPQAAKRRRKSKSTPAPPSEDPTPKGKKPKGQGKKTSLSSDNNNKVPTTPSPEETIATPPLDSPPTARRSSRSNSSSSGHRSSLRPLPNATVQALASETPLFDSSDDSDNALVIDIPQF